jgi:2,3-bisphosphoglycerate-independent phosphoglycerate mutase
MKYALIIPDGAADEPLDELGGKTPLQAANTPNLDAIAATGRLGTVLNIPPNLPAGSDVATLSVLGCDPQEVYTGRAPLEAASRDIQVTPQEWIFRCNLVTIIDGEMLDYSAGGVSDSEAKAIVTALQNTLGGGPANFYQGVGYRHILTLAEDVDLTTTPPHDIMGQPIKDYLPKGKGAETVRKLMERAETILADSEINAVRRDLGENPASNIWLWGEGKMPSLPSFEATWGLRGATVAAVDLVRGMSKLLGLDVIDVPGATGYIETNFAGKGAAAVKALDEYDFVFTHIEAPDEAGHNADITAKVHAIEQIDEHIVGPVLKRLQAEGEDWRILVLPDHPTPCRVRTHTREPVPFAIAGRGIDHIVSGPFCEDAADQSDLHIERGCNLMEFFLTVR